MFEFDLNFVRNNFSMKLPLIPDQLIKTQPKQFIEKLPQCQDFPFKTTNFMQNYPLSKTLKLNKMGA